MNNTRWSHWPEYLIEATLLGLLMVSASVFTMLLAHPDSAVIAAIPDPFFRRTIIGIAMGLTAIGLIYSPPGKRSGAHMNPAVTMTFMRLGKIKPLDAAGYVVAQFAGAIAGLVLVTLSVREWFADPAVKFIATLPGPGGTATAFGAEFIISFILMLSVLLVSNTPKLARWTGVFAGCLVATFITFEAPLSGMSMNPARSFASAFVGQLWTALWIYFTAPVIAMQLAACIYQRTGRVVYCAKLHHHNDAPCIFNCAFDELAARERQQPVTVVHSGGNLPQLPGSP
jgi:aquaporin Z